MTGFEMCNKYQIKNSVGQLVYFATEGLLFLSNHTSRVDTCPLSSHGYLFVWDFGTSLSLHAGWGQL